MYSNASDTLREYNPTISKIYKKYILNSSIITSWPDAPDLDNEERYINFSTLSKDMFDETFFRMPNLPSLSTTGMAPIFLKNTVYSRKKEEFKTSDKKTFDSYKNMFLFYMFIDFFKDDFFRKLNLLDTDVDNLNETDNNIINTTDNSLNLSDDSNSEDLNEDSKYTE